MKHLLPLALGLSATAIAQADWLTPAQATDDPATATELAQTEMPVDTATAPPAAGTDAIALSFDPPQTSPSTAPTPPAPASDLPPDSLRSPATATSNREDLFAGGSESVVARTVGAAEGTRAPDGGKTDIYEGHVDPGNGVWNRGTFSYQFGNNENLTADEADRRQMAKIKRIYESVLLAKANQHGVAPLTLAEELNGIDLINQAPLAVTEEGGYIERLAEAKTKKGLAGQAAILEARIWAFWDASRGGWDAPGLRAYDDMGKEASIRHDQKRRMGMIEEALTAYQETHGAIAERPSTKGDRRQVAIAPTASSTASDREQRADQIIGGASGATGVPISLMPSGVPGTR